MQDSIDQLICFPEPLFLSGFHLISITDFSKSKTLSCFEVEKIIVHKVTIIFPDVISIEEANDILDLFGMSSEVDFLPIANPTNYILILYHDTKQ